MAGVITLQSPKKPWERLTIPPSAVRRLQMYDALRWINPRILRAVNRRFLFYTFDPLMLKVARTGDQTAKDSALNGLVNEIMIELDNRVEEANRYLSPASRGFILGQIREAARWKLARALGRTRPATDEEFASWTLPLDVIGLADTTPREIPSAESEAVPDEADVARRGPRADWPQDDEIVLITPKQFRKLSRRLSILLARETKDNLTLNELERLTWTLGRWLELKQGGSLAA